jgi:hypothetical protein
MDPTLVGALSAVMGSLVGGAATMATGLITQRNATRRERAFAEIRKREVLYAEFVSECTRLAIDACIHGLERPETVFPAFALLNRIRLTSSPEVLAAADRTLKFIGDQYFEPNLTIAELRELARSTVKKGPLEEFSEACRVELAALGEQI